MGFKWLGKLLGKATSAMTASAPANTITPYAAPVPGSKFLSIGEANTSAAFNRGLSALQENIEHLAGILYSPALADTRLVASDVAGDPFGFTVLHDTTATNTQIDLQTTSGTGVPVVWVYVGLHKDQLDRFVRLYRYGDSTQAAQQSYGGDVSATLSEVAHTVYPSDAWGTPLVGSELFVDSAGTPQAYLAHATIRSPHSLVSFIPPIQHAPNFSFAGGITTHAAVRTWWSDGISLERSWADCGALPGCFVHFTGAGTNSGLYQIASIRGVSANGVAADNEDKAVLTRGGLTRVTVTDATSFLDGHLICWALPPDDQADLAPASERVNYAYIAFKDGNTLYLAPVKGEPDTPSTYPAFVSFKTDGVTGTYGPAFNIGSVGVVDLETGADTASNLRVGSYIYDAVAPATKTTVVSVIPAFYPVQFDTSEPATPTAYICNPLGFSLNPTLIVPSGSLGKGNYFLHCKVLTTVKDKLTNGGATGQWQTTFDPSDRVDVSPFEAAQARAFALAAKYGREGPGALSYPNNAFSPTRMVLGSSLLEVVFTAGGGAEIVDYAAPGDTLTFVTPTTGYQTTAVVASVFGNTAVVTDIDNSAWPIEARVDTAPATSIYNGCTVTLAGPKVFTVAANANPSNDPFLPDYADNPYEPGYGLDASYNNHYAAPKAARRPGRGNFVRLASGRPITAVLPTAANGETVFRSYAVNGNSQVILEHRAKSGAEYHVRVHAVGKALGLSDGYATSPVPLSGLYDTSLEPDLGTNLLAAINYGVNFRSTLVASTVSIVVPPTLSYDAGSPNFVVLSDSEVASGGRYYTVAGAYLPVSGAAPSYIYWDPALGAYDSGPVLPANSELLVGNCAAGGLFPVSSAMALKNTNDCIDINVGGYGAHFSTFYDALVFVNRMGTAKGRKYTIYIRGTTTEPAYTSTFEVDNVLVRGVPGASDSASAINMTSKQCKIDLNGRSNIVFRDLEIRAYSEAAVSAAVDWVLFDNTSVTTSQGIVFDSVRIAAVVAPIAGTYRLHGFLDSSGTGGYADLQVRNCSWSGATDFGIRVKNSATLRIANCTLLGTAGPPGGPGVPGAQMVLSPGAIALTNCSRVWITDCYCEYWQDFGIQVVAEAAPKSSVRVILRGNVVEYVAGRAGGDAYGVFVSGATCQRVKLVENTVTYITSTAMGHSVGIYADYTYGNIRDNYIDVGPVLGGGVNQSIYLPGAAAPDGYIIVEGNETRAITLVDSTAHSHVSASNLHSP